MGWRGQGRVQKKGTLQWFFLPRRQHPTIFSIFRVQQQKVV